MVSAIDDTKPADDVLASKADLRSNFGSAKTEIEDLQNRATDLLTALGLGVGQSAFDPIGGDNTPSVAASFQTIVLALDAAITAAAQVGGGGPATLADITDILDPSGSIRLAFQAPVDATTEDADFTFSLAEHAGRLITLDTVNDSVTMTLPEASTLTDREDGYLCSVEVTSIANFGAITGAADDLRLQQNIFNNVVTQTTVFVGRSRAAGRRSHIDIYKDGGNYTIVGPARVTETDDLTFGAPGSLNASALVAESLLAATFPALLDLGGTKQTGGGRGVIVPIAGNHTFAQTNAGKTIEHTGAGTATYSVPALLAGTVIEVDNAIGGEITFTDTGSQTFVGGTTLSAGAAGAVKWLNGGVVRLIGTV